jgi:hypothetical protein
VKAADTSLVVAAFASWHDKHEHARRALDAGLRLPEYCALETYSVLTRLPPPHRAPGDLVREFLLARFPEPLLRMSARTYRDFISSLPDRDSHWRCRVRRACRRRGSGERLRARQLRPPRSAYLRALRRSHLVALKRGLSRHFRAMHVYRSSSYGCAGRISNWFSEGMA